jgi:chromosome partitioning protein
VEQTGTATVDVAPSDIDLSATENQLFSVIGREHALREVLHGWAEKHYAYIIIDCPPTLGLLTLNALVASDGVVIPVQTQYYSLKGFTALNTVITQIRAKGLNPRLRILGILPTFYDGRTNLARGICSRSWASWAITTSSRPSCDRPCAWARRPWRASRSRRTPASRVPPKPIAGWPRR